MGKEMLKMEEIDCGVAEVLQEEVGVGKGKLGGGGGTIEVEKERQKIVS